MIEFLKQEKTVGQVDFVEPMLNLLAHAQSIELDLGSECGGHGICGKDRVQVRPEDEAFLSNPTEVEKEHLSEKELISGIRLACQCFPNAPGHSLKLRIPL